MRYKISCAFESVIQHDTANYVKLHINILLQHPVALVYITSLFSTVYNATNNNSLTLFHAQIIGDYHVYKYH
jgi:hypothetical protein